MSDEMMRIPECWKPQIVTEWEAAKARCPEWTFDWEIEEGTDNIYFAASHPLIHFRVKEIVHPPDRENIPKILGKIGSLERQILEHQGL